MLGGAVRRLRERRPDHHRPVHRGRRGQVGPDLRPGHAAAPRLRGPGPRALARPASSGSSPSPPRTTSRSPTPPPPAQYFHLLRRQMLRDGPQAADRLHAEVAAAGQAVPLPVDELTVGLVRGGARRPRRHGDRRRRSTPRRVRLGQGRRSTPLAARDEARRRAGRHRPGRAALPVAVRRRGRRSLAQLPQRQRDRLAPGGAREHGPLELRQGPPVRGPRATPTRSSASAAPSRAAPPPAPRRIHDQEQEDLLAAIFAADE